MKYLFKPIYTDGEVTGYEEPRKIKGNPPIPKDYKMVETDIENPALDITDGVMTVSEDTTAKKNSDIYGKYDELNTDIYLESATKLGTTNLHSASADAETWELMIEDPDFFVDVSCHRASTSYSVGDVLDTATKVTEYATEMKLIKKQFALYRLERIATYRTERQTILDA